MSDTEVAQQVLNVLKTRTEPVPAKELIVNLQDRQIPGSQSRRAIVHLAEQQQIRITNDRKLYAQAG